MAAAAPRSTSTTLPLPDAFAVEEPSSPGASTSKDLLATLDPYGGDVAAWLNDLLDPADDYGGVSLAGDEVRPNAHAGTCQANLTDEGALSHPVA
jgi:hypothetical protein